MNIWSEDVKKFITVALLLLSPLPVLALDAAEANSRHQKAWYELIVKTDALLGVKTVKPLPTYPITAQMNTILGPKQGEQSFMGQLMS